MSKVDDTKLIRELKNEVRDLRVRLAEIEVPKLEELTNAVWSVYQYKPDPKKAQTKFKIVKLNYSLETKQGIITDILTREHSDVTVAIGYATQYNDEFVIKKSQGRLEAKKEE